MNGLRLVIQQSQVMQFGKIKSKNNGMSVPVITMLSYHPAVCTQDDIAISSANVYLFHNMHFISIPLHSPFSGYVVPGVPRQCHKTGVYYISHRCK